MSLPNFNLTCNIWRSLATPPAIPPAGPPAVVSICNLQFGRKRAESDAFGGVYITMWLLLPPRTDIRGIPWIVGVVPGDVVEVPAGSGRFYGVGDVDDVSRGFPGEYRVASIVKARVIWAAAPPPVAPLP